MANKRMINKNIIDTDLFLQMPMSARLLYYDFCMRADDDGFIDAPVKIMKSIGCSQDDLNILVSRKYIIPFESKVCVIRHWLIHNTIRKDRYSPTIHIDERNQLLITDKTYDLDVGLPSGNQLATTWQPSIEKNSSNNSNIYENEILDDETFMKIFEIIEKEFGRTISPLEIETIKTWIYPLEILKLAVKEASTSGNFSIKYIDKIIYNWKKANVRSVADVNKYIADFNAKKEKRKGSLPNKQNLGADYEVLE